MRDKREESQKKPCSAICVANMDGRVMYGRKGIKKVLELQRQVIKAKVHEYKGC